MSNILAHKIKPSYNTNRISLGENLPLDTPLSVIMDTSERCNFRCVYCFRAGEQVRSWGYAASNALMSWEVFERAAKQLSWFPHKIKLISLSGHGEPLCHPDLVKMAHKLNELGVTERIEMHTNASLLTEENAAVISKAGFSRIVVSLQGLDAATYKKVCGVKINWEQFYNNLKLLYENKDQNLKIHMKISDMALNKEKYQEEENKFYSLFSDIADSAFVENAVPLWENICIESATTKNKYGYDYSDINYCPLVFYKIVIAPNGEIYPCTRLPEPVSLGNIHDITVFDAWNSRERLDFLKEHLQYTRHNFAPCSGCFVPINSVMSQEDIIDSYKDIILQRIEKLTINER